MVLDDKIFRHYTKELEDKSITVYDLFKWKKVDIILKNYSTGEIITELIDQEFPEQYSQSACDIIASKYFRKKGLPDSIGQEFSMKQVVHRMVSFWVEAMEDEGLITKQQKNIVYDELAYMMLAQIWAPNSPQWFNTGLNLAYGIKGNSQGHYYYDEQKQEVVASKDSYTRTQGSACFIISVEDALLGSKSLTEQIATETLLFKYGSGVGTNWSSIRGKEEILSGGGRSSGLLSFLKVSDRNAGAIKSGGTTRRAAKMNILNLDHPEIMEYITWKSVEEDKVRALAKMGYSTSIDGDAYETVSGQNANNSIRIPNEFMKKISEENSTWKTIGRVDESVNKELKVADIWNKTVQAAWACGDPGVQFDDTINAWHTCPAGEDGDLNNKNNRINSSNPCSEYMFLDDTACNLASINIVKFYDVHKNVFDIEGYTHAIKMIQMVLEATIHWGQFPTQDIARKSFAFRTTGLGLTNMGALFMLMTLPYDSDEARTIGASLTSIMTGYSYYISSLMAQKVGCFKGYETNKTHMLKVINNHARVANYNKNDIHFEDLDYSPITIEHEILKEIGMTEISNELKNIWTNTLETGRKYGFRNAQVSVLAPTGTIAFAMDCDTNSSEPFFSHIAYKKLVGGSFMTRVNPLFPQTLNKLGYNKQQIEDISEYIMRTDSNGMVIDGKIENAPHLKKEHYSIFDTANKCGTGERYISASGHVKMMGALTPNVTGAISKTVNLPNDATQDDVRNMFMLSWVQGVKAIAIYRDGSKAGQPLNTSINKQNEIDFSDYSYSQLLDYANSNNVKLTRRKPFGIRNAKVHEASINGLKLYITVSFYEDNRIGEVYVSCGRQGSLTKGLLDSISTIISVMLQYGIPAKDISQMYRGQKYEPSGIVVGHPNIKFVDSISDLISKIIDIELGDYTYCQVKPEGNGDNTLKLNDVNEIISKKYKASEYTYSDVCYNCKSSKMVKNGTCKVCTECGSTTGCS